MKRKIEPLIFQVLQESSTWGSLGITENVMAESCEANVYFEYDILMFLKKELFSIVSQAIISHNNFYILRICTFVLDRDYPIDTNGSLDRQCFLDMFYTFFKNSL